jgi:glycosyltransferase involved in cell wall biosynthesis
MALRTNQKRDDLVLCIGRIVRNKYVDHAIKAFAQVGRGHLAIVGPVLDPAYYAFLQSEVRRLNIARLVTFVDGVEHAEASAWFRSSSVTILASRVEGQGLVLAEAALQESWPIAAEEAAGSLIRQMGTGSTYPWGDIKGLSRCIDQALSNSLDVRNRASAGRTWVLANLNPDHIASKVGREYEQVLA